MMVYSSNKGDLDLSKLTRLYPAAVVEMYGEVAEMSLEWIETNQEKVTLRSFVLVFDFTPLNEDVKDRVVLEFDTKEELFETMNEVAQLFQN